MRLFQAIEDQFPEADRELEPVESYLAYFRQLLLWQREASAPATEEELARLNPLLRRQLSQLLQFSVLENDWYIVNTLVQPSIAHLAGCVESQNQRDLLLSPARRAVVERALALALTLPENQVQWKETTAAHWKRLGYNLLSVGYIEGRREAVTRYLSGVVERKPLILSVPADKSRREVGQKPIIPGGLADTLRKLRVRVRHASSWMVTPTV